MFVWGVVNPSISHLWGDNHFPMAHGVEVGPGGPELFWINPEPSRLLCSGPNNLGANWEGLDLAWAFALGTHSLSIGCMSTESLVPVPQVLTMYTCSMVGSNIIWVCFVEWDGPLIPRVLGRVVLSLPKTLPEFE